MGGLRDRHLACQIRRHTTLTALLVGGVPSRVNVRRNVFAGRKPVADVVADIEALHFEDLVKVRVVLHLPERGALPGRTRTTSAGKFGRVPVHELNRRQVQVATQVRLRAGVDRDADEQHLQEISHLHSCGAVRKPLASRKKLQVLHLVVLHDDGHGLRHHRQELQSHHVQLLLRELHRAVPEAPLRAKGDADFVNDEAHLLELFLVGPLALPRRSL